MRVRSVEETRPPIIGAAIRFIGPAPAPPVHMIGISPIIVVATINDDRAETHHGPLDDRLIEAAHRHAARF